MFKHTLNLRDKERILRKQGRYNFKTFDIACEEQFRKGEAIVRDRQLNDTPFDKSTYIAEKAYMVTIKHLRRLERR